MLGFAARIETQSPVFNPRIDIEYLYHQMESSETAQAVTLKWFEFQIKAGFLLRLGPLHVTMGAFHHAIDGDETTRGAITQTRRFNEDEAAGGFIDLTLFVDPTGTVGITAEGGGRSSVNLVFAREF